MKEYVLWQVPLIEGSFMNIQDGMESLPQGANEPEKSLCSYPIQGLQCNM